MNIKSQYDIKSITAPSIDRYLQLSGWRRDYEFNNKHLMVYETKSRGDNIKKISLPVNENYDDFYDTVSRILHFISNYQNKSVQDIIKDINTTFVDRLEFRILYDMSVDGKIPIEYAAECIEGLKELFLYSVCAEQVAQPICLRASDTAKSYLNNFKMAQTEKGSFVINIDIKVVDETKEQLVLHNYDIPMPFEHKVVKRICNAITQIDDVVQRKAQISYLAQDAYKTGMTANMCDALLKMRPKTNNAAIDTTIRYASALTQKPGAHDNIKFDTMHFLVIDELGKIYRNNTIIQDVSLTGLIRTLSTKEADDGIEKSIRLYTIVDGKSRTVMIELNDDQHIMACDAYRDGKEINVSGELDMSGRLWAMKKVFSFAVR